MAGLFLGLEPLVKLHHAFSILHSKYLVRSGESLDVHFVFKPQEYSRISFAVEKAGLSAFCRPRARSNLIIVWLLFFVFDTPSIYAKRYWISTYNSNIKFLFQINLL